MIVWYMYESLTEESVQDGDVADHGFVNDSGTYVSMADAWGDRALHRKHQAAVEWPVWPSPEETDYLARVILDKIGTPDSVDDRGDEVIFYGDGSNATLDGEPYLSSVSVEGNPSDITRLIEAVKPTKER